MKAHHLLITVGVLTSLQMLPSAQAQPRAVNKASAPAPQASATNTGAYNRVMDSLTCTTAPRSEWLPEDEMRLLAEHRGYRIKTFRVDKNNCYEIYGFNRQNHVVEAYFDPVTSRLRHQNTAQ
jgi:hypothetical protein